MAGKVDYFLKITGIDGESKDQKHKGEIELEELGVRPHERRLGGLRRGRRHRERSARATSISR